MCGNNSSVWQCVMCTRKCAASKWWQGLSCCECVKAIKKNRKVPPQHFNVVRATILSFSAILRIVWLWDDFPWTFIPEKIGVCLPFFFHLWIIFIVLKCLILYKGTHVSFVSAVKQTGTYLYRSLSCGVQLRVTSAFPSTSSLNTLVMFWGPLTWKSWML